MLVALFVTYGVAIASIVIGGLVMSKDFTRGLVLVVVGVSGMLFSTMTILIIALTAKQSPRFIGDLEIRKYVATFGWTTFGLSLVASSLLFVLVGRITKERCQH